MKTINLQLSFAQLQDLSEMAERSIDEIEMLCTPAATVTKAIAEKREILEVINTAIKIFTS